MKPERQEPRDIFKIHAPFAPLLERLFGLRRFAAIYDDLVSRRGERNFPAHVLEAMAMSFDVADEEFGSIPAQGPLVVIANHPFGGVEGMILLDLLQRVRPDVRVLANSLLCRIPELRQAIIPVNPFGGRSAAAANRTPLRVAIRWVRGGGALLIFPAGSVAHLSLRRREICDPPWQPHLARLLRACAAPVLPVFFPGHNGLFFQLAGLLHPRVRTLLLPREFLNKSGRRFPLRIAHAIPWKKLSGLAEDRELMDYLRLKTYLLGCGGGGEGPPAESGDGLPPAKAEMEPVIPPQSPAILIEEIGRLPKSQLLTESGGMQVFQARAAQIPYALLEIGRLRELTFRAAGEGTGRRFDLDAFDEHYTHLFIWNRDALEIIGAYRLGKTDEILRELGKKGLYTQTLFHFRTRMLAGLGPALEMGRSFVREEYQRGYAPLLLLWKGIGRYVSENPRYRMLFGPVSISRDYSDVSRRLIAETLQESLSVPELARMVKPRIPMRVKRVRIKGCAPETTRAVMRDIEELSALIADIEIDQKGIPVLLRHYLNLGGKLLAFNLDPEFGDVLDGLVLVDLMRTDRRTLARYMGKGGAEAFRAYHENLATTSLADCA
jgi:putative hemolysin